MKKTNLAQEDNAKSMEVGQVGYLGPVVEVIVRCQDLEVVQILLLKMEDLNVWVTKNKTKAVLEDYARSMEDGEVGHLGQAVEVIVRCQDLEVVTIQHLPMEDLNVWVEVKKIKLALKVNAKSMEGGEAGLLGLFV